MNENATKSLTEVVRRLRDRLRTRHAGLANKAYGYPAASPFNGQSLYSCSGTVVQDTFGGSTDQGLACNMTGGSSGGGWITGGSLNSVTGFGYTGVKNVLWGPYFGTVIQTVYNPRRVTATRHPGRPLLVPGAAGATRRPAGRRCSRPPSRARGAASP